MLHIAEVPGWWSNMAALRLMPSRYTSRLNRPAANGTLKYNKGPINETHILAGIHYVHSPFLHTYIFCERLFSMYVLFFYLPHFLSLVAILVVEMLRKI